MLPELLLIGKVAFNKKDRQACLLEKF